MNRRAVPPNHSVWVSSRSNGCECITWPQWLSSTTDWPYVVPSGSCRWWTAILRVFGFILMEPYELYVVDKHQFYSLRIIVALVEIDKSAYLLDVMLAALHNPQLRLA